MTTTAAPVGIRQEASARISKTVAWAAIAVIFAAVYAGSLFSPALLDDADSTHAEAAREMLVRGDYVTLHVNGIRYLEKAPLIYWLVAFGFRIFGVHAFAARIPSVLAILLLAVLAYRWGKRAFGDRAGIYGALFVCTSAGYFLFTRITIPDALLSLLIAASLYFFLIALEWNGRRMHWYAGYLALGTAVLAKGLVALVIVGATAFFYLLLSGEWKRWREFHLGTGLLLIVTVAAPWHVLAGLRNKGFLWFYFINEHVLRFLGKRYPKDYNKLPASLYWALHLVWLFPWSMYLPLAIRDFLQNRKLRAGTDSDFAARTRLLLAVWAGVVLVFFAFSTNQEYYTMPAYLPIILLIAAALSRDQQDDGSRRWLTYSTAVYAGLAMTAGLVLLAGLWMSRHLPFTPDVGSVLAEHDMSEDTLAMSHMLDLSAASFAALRLPSLLAALSLLFAPIAALILRTRRKHYLATWTIAGGMALFLIAAHIALVRFEPYLSSRPLAEKIAPELAPQDRIMIYGDQAFGSSLLLYLKRPIELVNGKTTSMWFGSQFADAPHIFLNDAGLQQAWTSDQRVFLFVPPFERKQVDLLIPAGKFVVAESSGKIIYSNRP